MIYAAVPAGRNLDTAWVSLLDPGDPHHLAMAAGRLLRLADYRGMARALEFFAAVGEHIQILAMELWLFIPTGQPGSWGHQKFLRTSTGYSWESSSRIITLRDGRWLHFRYSHNFRR